ncbi:hypothetical protein ABZP36_035807 [Zizania latifolia]
MSSSSSETAAGGGGGRSNSKTTTTKVAVVYYLCRSRQGGLEHPHLMEVEVDQQQPRPLRLRDVTQRLEELRGRGMAAMYSWSCKRSYRSGFVWQDLSHPDDLLLPTHAGDYVLKASLLHSNNPTPLHRHHHHHAARGPSTRTLPFDFDDHHHHHGDSDSAAAAAHHVSVSTATSNHTPAPTICLSPSPSSAVNQCNRTRPPHSSSSSSSSSGSISSSPNNNKLMPAAAEATAACNKNKQQRQEEEAPLSHVVIAAATQAEADDDSTAAGQKELPLPLQGRQGKIASPDPDEKSILKEKTRAATGGSSRTLESLIMADPAFRRLLEDAEADTDSSRCSMSMGAIYKVKPANLLMRFIACGTSLPVPASGCRNHKNHIKKKSKQPDLILQPQLESLPSSPVLSPLSLAKHPPPTTVRQPPPTPQQQQFSFSGGKLKQLQDRHHRRVVATEVVPAAVEERSNAGLDAAETSGQYRLVSADASAGKNRSCRSHPRMGGHPSTAPCSSRRTVAFWLDKDDDKLIKIEERLASGARVTISSTAHPSLL